MLFLLKFQRWQWVHNLYCTPEQSWQDSPSHRHRSWWRRRPSASGGQARGRCRARVLPLCARCDSEFRPRRAPPHPPPRPRLEDTRVSHWTWDHCSSPWTWSLTLAVSRGKVKMSAMQAAVPAVTSCTARLGLGAGLTYPDNKSEIYIYLIWVQMCCQKFGPTGYL